MPRGGVLTILALWIVGGCGGSPPAVRSEEVWVVDFQTYAAQVDAALEPRGLDRARVEEIALTYLRTFFEGLDIRFRAGAAAGSGESYICVREAQDDVLGRGILDLGNQTVDSACGLRHGLIFGVFAENVLAVIDGQGLAPTEELVGRLLAVVLAHEVGHGLGLTHSAEYGGPGDIMTGNGVLDARQEEFYFVPEHRALLEENLDFSAPPEPPPLERPQVILR